MRGYKLFDFAGQLITLLLMAAGYWLDASGALLSVSMITLLVLQLSSLVVHAAIGRKTWKSPLRSWHALATILVLLVIVYGMLKPAEDKYDFSGLGIMIKALVPAAAVAVFYTVICGLEWKALQQKGRHGKLEAVSQSAPKK